MQTPHVVEIKRSGMPVPVRNAVSVKVADAARGIESPQSSEATKG